MEVIQYNSVQGVKSVSHPECVFEQRHFKQAYNVFVDFGYANNFVDHLLHVSMYEDGDVHGKLNKRAEYRLIAKAQAGDEKALIMLTENFAPLIYSFASDYTGRGMEFIDLVQSGYEGFQKAVMQFDPSFDVRLVTHAYWWIKQELDRAVIGNSFIRLPYKRFRQFLELKTRLDRGESLPEVAKAIGEPLKVALTLADILPGRQSLDTAKNSEHDGHLHDTLADEKAYSSEDQFFVHEELKLLDSFLDRLEPEMQPIICMRYGLRGNNAHTLDEIADALKGQSNKRWDKEKVRTYIDKAILRMQCWSNNLDRNVLDVKESQSPLGSDSFLDMPEEANNQPSGLSSVSMFANPAPQAEPAKRVTRQTTRRGIKGC